MSKEFVINSANNAAARLSERLASNKSKIVKDKARPPKVAKDRRADPEEEAPHSILGESSSPHKQVVDLEVHELGKKRSKYSEEYWCDDLKFEIPGDVSAYADPGIVLQHVAKFVFPEDKKQMKSMGISNTFDFALTRTFQSIQAQAFLREEVSSSIRQLKEATSEIDAEKKKIEELKEAHATSLKKVGDLETKFNEVRKEADLLKNESNEKSLQIEGLQKAKIELERKVENLRQECMDTIDHAILKTRYDHYVEFRDGKADQWEVHKVIAEYEELEKLKDGGAESDGLDVQMDVDAQE